MLVRTRTVHYVPTLLIGKKSELEHVHYVPHSLPVWNNRLNNVIPQKFVKNAWSSLWRTTVSIVSSRTDKMARWHSTAQPRRGYRRAASHRVSGSSRTDKMARCIQIHVASSIR